MTTQNVDLKDRISQVLEEIRVVVPGSQALLGFQLVALFSNGFGELPEGIQLVHLTSLGLIALTTIFLMAPSAYHRIAYDGRTAPPVLRFASRMLVAAMFFLLCGLSADVWVAAYVVMGTLKAAWLAGSVCFVIGFLLWFAYPSMLSLRK